MTPRRARSSIRHGPSAYLHLVVGAAATGGGARRHLCPDGQRPIMEMGTGAPGEIPPNNLKASWAASRKRLFAIIEDLVKWENTTNEDVLEKARAEIRKSWRETCELNKDHPQAAELFNPDKLPAFHDPFAGGGAIPLEAQRLGLEPTPATSTPSPCSSTRR